MNKVQLLQTVKKLQIKSIMNLCGPNPGQEWYDSEVNVSSFFGLNHYDIRMNAKSLPSPETAIQVLDALKRGPFPMLIHCNAGADRSGLVSALYLIYCRGESSAQASKQLSLLLGHVPLGSYLEMDEFLNLYDRYNHGKDLHEWVDTEYPQIYRERAEK